MSRTTKLEEFLKTSDEFRTWQSEARVQLVSVLYSKTLNEEEKKNKHENIMSQYFQKLEALVTCFEGLPESDRLQAAIIPRLCGNGGDWHSLIRTLADAAICPPDSGEPSAQELSFFTRLLKALPSDEARADALISIAYRLRDWGKWGKNAQLNNIIQTFYETERDRILQAIKDYPLVHEREILVKNIEHYQSGIFAFLLQPTQKSLADFDEQHPEIASKCTKDTVRGSPHKY